MHALSLPDIAERYFRRFGFHNKMIDSAPPEGMLLSIVIPCYDEPELLLMLNSLRACHPPKFPVEVLLVFNCGVHEEEVRESNRHSLQAASSWAEEQQTEWLRLHCLWIDALPPKHAGVGLARKVGMDEALRRFAQLNYKGMIVCLDADCRVAPDYLQVLEQVQTAHAPGSCTIHFEHLPEQVSGVALQQGIVYYELFLRYYVNALAYSGYPYTMHTIGSSMGARADIYALSGGMNRRKAGEDFYFLHKVVPLGDFYKVDNTCVYPSGRLSARVPFGTGKAQHDWLEDPQKKSLSYHYQTFCDLKIFLEAVPSLYQADDAQYCREVQVLPESVKNFVSEHNLEEVIKEIKANSSAFPTFYKKFFAWFDGFKALKFVHYCRDYYYKEVELLEAGQWLLKQFGSSAPREVSELLRLYRLLDKNRQAVKLI